ncbi:hypothetical protein [Pseudoalteromonas ruthenica]|uniref:Uncharacterized protein n=1 Tax=Pseudoalteromonas ruthenica TaxID=151081 RepID=A0A0F4PWG7_9GAMM|nr:hypothetical protein [Pseudoalteromonas ruthenica]KJY99142.1 hypothetical protein TW76_05595 [Pseudoalteromonas ruthenica]KJY99815.1 hypothetical protein TW72_09300 [Pseudoalteromonas ruthenica]TMO88338.1 hypothetical protein CWC12_09180 [Pseudoalteromonas ruthenica]TMO92980.1 hypothetical protein CWC13_07550 [Pseudoalteromonas ruthenica]TMP00530.1 hypothetical protein CWC07_04805 [Pseudoalteromonas ruthenica]
MFEIYYQSKIPTIGWDFYITIAITLSLVFSFFFLKRLYEDKLKLSNIMDFRLLFSLVFLYFLTEIYSYYELFETIERIESGELVSVEGIIKELDISSSSSRSERFKVGKVSFDYNDFGTSGLFFANRAHDSKVIKEGNRVKISYLPKEDDNLIFEIKVFKPNVK